MKKVKVATVWLEGCSGCHMSLLDMDAAIISLAQKIDWLRPLVDTQEFPEGVDVRWSDGRVISQDDLNKLPEDPQRTHPAHLTRRLPRSPGMCRHAEFPSA